MLQIEDMQKTKLTAKGQSAAGNPTNDLQGPLAWVSTDPTVVGTTAQPDPNCYAEAEGPLGSAIVSVSGKNAKGDTITGQIQIGVKAGPTVAILIEAATPEAR